MLICCVENAIVINESDEEDLLIDEIFYDYDDDVCLMDVSVIDEIIEELEALKERNCDIINKLQ